jgi:hypothetical protein
MRMQPTLTSATHRAAPSRRASWPIISVITITGSGDQLRPEWPITFTGIRKPAAA